MRGCVIAGSPTDSTHSSDAWTKGRFESDALSSARIIEPSFPNLPSYSSLTNHLANPKQLRFAVAVGISLSDLTSIDLTK